ncbi:hypothetical protein INS49_002668 [Diaporthe citri]|uniref:uncharacterized protein n=1 Tax=Diaporthe citri TaxID=83186 RepID=UPI001C815EB4|nr:uncharacterized protein INS49_002668 [Diaporthe citri]KAG6368461.1 hypothetical protein INS49_002668 [Diaporthe citri]
MASSGHVPESWSSAEALTSDAGGPFDLTGGHQQQKLRYELTLMYQSAHIVDGSENIRILHLLPGKRDDPIRTRLQSCSVGNPPSYEAVSYAWGSKLDNAVIIVCEGGVDYHVEIPRSLHGALKQLRHDSNPRLIWADAICINQTDDEEKSCQVRLMRQIYQKATRVVIWLGDDYEAGCGASTLFGVISQMNHGESLAMPPPEDHDFWIAFGQLYRSPWLSRLWCLQEAVLAPSAQAMLGEHSTPWKHIGFAATCISDVPAQTFQYDDSALLGVHNACLIYGLSHSNESRQLVSFLQLLTLTRPFVASDSRDKIYGILGIPTTDSDPDAGEPFLQPDYTKTLSEVYIDCSLAIIRKTQSLRLLSYVQHGQLPRRVADVPALIAADETLVKVPSWVPRWHQYFSRTLAPQEEEPKTFEASASMKTHSVPKTDVRGLELIAYGARVTRVKTVSRIIDASKTLRHTSAKTANKLWVEFIGPLKASTSDPGELFYTLSTLLTAGKDWLGGVIEDREQHFADFLALIYDPILLSGGDPGVLRRRFMEADEGGEPPKYISWAQGPLFQKPNVLQDLLFRPRTDLALPPVAKTGRAHCFQEAMRGACTWRRLIVTENGHVGLGPQATELGDVVCILEGAIMPLILRPEADSDSFKLVGEAYVQGMMFGEVKISEVEQIVLSDKPFVDPVGLNVNSLPW